MTSVSSSELNASGQSITDPSFLTPDGNIDTELYARSLFFLAAMIQSQVAPVSHLVETDSSSPESSTSCTGNSSCKTETSGDINSRLGFPILPTTGSVQLNTLSVGKLEIEPTTSCNTFNHSENIVSDDGFSKSVKDNHASKSRLNKFVRSLHDMLVDEKDSGIVEWRRGLLVLNSTDEFTQKLLPKYFNSSNFKTFRRQLNYYGFVHVRSFSSSENATTALWVNHQLSNPAIDYDSVESVLMLRRVEPYEGGKAKDGRRERKQTAMNKMRDDIDASSKLLSFQQIKTTNSSVPAAIEQILDANIRPIPSEIHCSATQPTIDLIPLADNDQSTMIHEDTSFGTHEDDHRVFESNHHSSSIDICFGSKAYTSSLEESTCAANVLLLLSKTE